MIMCQFSPKNFLLGLALLALIALIALPLTILVTLVLMRRFRGRVMRSMRAAAGTPVPPESDRSPLGRPLGELVIELLKRRSSGPTTLELYPFFARHDSMRGVLQSLTLRRRVRSRS
jgi:hypothetical protein